MSLDAWKLWVDIGQFALTGLVAFFVWLTRQSQVNRDAISRLSGDLDERIDQGEARLIRLEAAQRSVPDSTQCAEHMRRIAEVEASVRHLPGQDDIKRIHARIDRSSELVAKVDGRLDGIERNLQLIIEQLLDQSGRGRS
jgi:hypothetical protein